MRFRLYESLAIDTNNMIFASLLRGFLKKCLIFVGRCEAGQLSWPRGLANAAPRRGDRRVFCRSLPAPAGRPAGYCESHGKKGSVTTLTGSDHTHILRRARAAGTLKEAFMELACLDLEGVLVPEIWINVAQRTGIEALRLTTRDIPDYDQLMRQRLTLLDQHGLKLSDIQRVIAAMGPLEGAGEFLDWLRERFQLVILSDTFYEFALPLMRQLGWPTLFCHRLEVTDDRVANYILRQADSKRQAVRAFHGLNFRVIAAGDSYNDTAMLAEAEAGILFRPPQNVIDEFPQFPVARTFEALREEFRKASLRSL